MNKKMMGYFRCNVCNIRGAQLARDNQWQSLQPHYHDCSAEQKANVWQDIGGMGSVAKMRKYLEERRSTVAIEKKNAGMGGGYYPRSWYERQGSDGELIGQTCQDKKEHPIWGTVYDVPIETNGDEIELRE